MLERIARGVLAGPFLAFGLFLLIRADSGDGFAAPLLVGSIAVALSLVVLATTFEPRRWAEAGVVALVVLAALPLYHDLVGAPGFAVNVVFAGLALLSATRLRSEGR